MSWSSRLLAGIGLALHLAAPVGAYTLARDTPDFGALCSVERPLPKAPASAPAGHSSSEHLTHCPLCGGAFAPAMPAPSALALSLIAGPTERAVVRALQGGAIATPVPLARGPPILS